MRWLIRQVERLPLGGVTRRAFVETLVDYYYERRGGLAATLRVAIAAARDRVSSANPFRFLGNDVRAAMRRLRRSPVYMAFSVVTLAIVIGATTGVYSVIYAALYRQQPIPNIEQVVNIYQSDLRYGASGPLMALSPHDLADLSASQTVFSSLAAWTRFSATLLTSGASEPLLGESVSGTYFSLLGVTPQFGRLIQPADDVRGAPPVIVLSDGLWRRAFGADPSAVGRMVSLQGRSFEVIGVAPAWFRGSDMPNLVPTPAWIPLGSTGGNSLSPTVSQDPQQLDRRFWWLKGRLRPSVTLEQAGAEVTAISQRIGIADPERRSQRYAVGRDGAPAAGWFVMRMADVRLHESVHVAAGPMASALMVAVLLVLLVGCSNLANLGLARSARRRHEIAVRVALGASRARIMRAELVESAIVAVFGWSLGIVIAVGLMNFLGQSVQMHAAATLTLQLVPSLNVPVLLVSLGATALAVVAVGLGPAWRQTKGNVRDAVASDGASVAPRWRMRGALVAGQVSASVLLLSLSVLCLRQLQSVTSHDPGFALDQLAVLQLDFSANQYDAVRVRQELAATSEIVGRTKDVASVSVMTALPIGSGRPASAMVSTPEDARGRQARMMSVSGPVFDTLNIPIVAGRPFADSDDAPASVAVISETLASDLYPGGAIGRSMTVAPTWPAGSPARLVTIVGVVADTDIDQFGGSRFSRQNAVYLPLRLTNDKFASVVARTIGSPHKALPLMRTAIRAVDPEVSVLTADTGYAIGGPAVLVLKVVGGLAGLLGGFALVLAVVGLYGVLADVVARRTREIGIRIALGAERRAIHRMVLLDGLRPVALGAAIGTLLAYYASIMLPVLLFIRQLPGPSLTSIGTAIVLLLVAAVVACYLPARRAARVDPNVALREL